MRPILGLVFFSSTLFAQVNLVPNPSFEQYDTCPNNASQINRAAPWTQPSTGTPDYFNVCSNPSLVGVPVNDLGHQNPRTGNGYGGFFARAGDYREYVQVQLTDSLRAGKKYCVHFFISLSDTVAYSIYTVGMFISNTPLFANNYYPLPFSPQIQNSLYAFFTYDNWTQVSGIYIASGGEKYITIGNFDSNLYPDTLLLNNNTTLYNPAVSYLYIDDISLALCEDSSNVFVPNIFTPNEDGLNDILEIQGLETATDIVFEIYNRWGTKVFETNYSKMFWDGRNTSGQPCLSGIYYYTLSAKIFDIGFSKKGFIQLIK